MVLRVCPAVTRRIEMEANLYEGGYLEPPDVINGTFAAGGNWPERIKELRGW